MPLNFSIFPDEYFPKDKPIGCGFRAEPRYVEAFFRNRTRFGTSLKDLAENYPSDESACLNFMEPDAFAFFLPLFMKFAVFEHDESDLIPTAVVTGLHDAATGYAGDRLKAISSTYSRNQRSVVVGFLHEMSRLESPPCYDPDRSMETARLLRKKFGYANAHRRFLTEAFPR